MKRRQRTYQDIEKQNTKTTDKTDTTEKKEKMKVGNKGSENENKIINRRNGELRKEAE